MSKLKVMVLAAAVLMFAGTKAKADAVVLNLEGIGNLNPIGDYYNGGGGGSQGVSFGAGAIAVVSLLDGGTGNIANTPSGAAAAIFLTGPGDFMNVAAGFSTGLSFYYSSIAIPGTITIWSGLNGTGSLLATLNLAPNGFCVLGPNYCNWTAAGVAFDGIAQSVNFTGSANVVAFDDITLGSLTPDCPPTATPEPTTMVLLGSGALGALGFRRKRLA